MAAEAEHPNLIEDRERARELLAREFAGRRRRRLQVVMITLTLYVATVVLGVFAFESEQSAHRARELALEKTITLQRSLPVKALGTTASISEEGWLINKDGTPVQRIAEGPLSIAIFAPNKHTFAVEGQDGVFVGRASAPHEIWRLPLLASVTSLSFSPDGHRLAVTDAGGTVWLWDLQARVAQVAFSSFYHDLRVAAFSPDGKRCAVGGGRGDVWVVDVATGEFVKELRTRGPVRSITFSDDQRTLLIGLQTGGSSVIEIDTGATLALFPG